MKKIYVGVLDSGVGGLSLLKELLKYPLGITYLYLGDNDNAPYGNLTKEKLIDLTTDNIEHLKNMGADSIIFACNTLSATLLKGDKDLFLGEKIFGVFPPINKKAIEKEKTLLLCTVKTAEKYIGEKNLTVYPLKNLAADIERNLFSLDKIDIKNHIKNVKPVYDTVILGCTHYFFVKNKIFNHLKPKNIYGGEKDTVKEICKYYKNKQNPYENEVLFVGKNAKINRDFFEKVVKNI